MQTVFHRSFFLRYMFFIFRSEVEEGMMELESTIEEGDDRADCEGTQVETLR
jgi:hypothetical protein